MRFLQPETWDRHGIANPGLRFFHERWRELLDYGVPLSHRAPLMTALGILRDLESTEREYAGSAYGKSAIKAIEQEAFGLEVQPFPKIPGTASADEVVQDLARDLMQQREKATKHFQAGGSPPEVAERRGSIAVRLMISRLEGSYLRELIHRLSSAIFNAPLEPGSIKRIDRLTTSLVAELLAAGHATSFLRTHIRILQLRSKAPSTELERFTEFCARLQSEASAVKVIFRVQGSSDLWNGWPSHLVNPEQSCPDLGPAALPEDWERFSISAGGVRFITLDAAALDHHAATKLAYQELQQLADLSFFRFAGNEPQVLAAATMRGAPPGTVVWVDDAKLELVEIPVPKKHRGREHDQAQVSAAFSAPHLSSATKRRLAGAVRYYRISIGQRWLESSFTNLWTALEVLASSDYEQNVIERVVRSIVPVLASKKVKSLTDDTLGYLLGIGAHLNPVFRERLPQVFEGPVIRPELLLGALAKRDSLSVINQIYGATSPLLCKRTADFHDAVTKGRTLAGRVYQTARRIEWQIRRLYRVRNAIIHGAGVTTSGDRLLSHLQNYVYETIVVEGALLSANNGLNTVEDVIAAVDGAFHTWLESMRDAKEVEELDVAAWTQLYRPPFEAFGVTQAGKTGV